MLIEREKAVRKRDSARDMPRVELRGLQPSIVDRLVDDRIGRLHPGLERGQIDEQLERRSRLALRLGRAVVDRRDIILAADHRPHRAVAVEATSAPCAPSGALARIALSAATCMPGVERRPHVDRLVASGRSACRAAAAPSR